MTFVNAIYEHLGYAPANIQPGKMVRFSTSDRKGDKSGWARLFDDGEGGVFGCWRSGVTEVWQAKQPSSEEERQAWKKKIEESKKKAQAELEKQRAECRSKSLWLWEKARDVDSGYFYLVKKGVKPHSAKQLRNMLLVPVRGVDGTLKGLQFIGEDGSKKFKFGTEISGNYCSIGKPKSKTLLVCEGWATGCTIYEATGYAVAVAFNAGNLLPVCQNLRHKYPSWKLIICADDDHGTIGNPGLTKAKEAASAVKGLLAVPDFTGLKRGLKLSDFNDMADLDKVRFCIEQAKDISPQQNENSANTPDSGKVVAEKPLLFDDHTAPDIPPSLLPSWLGDMATAVARSTQTPTAMAVLLALSTVATVIAKRFDVAPHGEGYFEPLNIWTVTALPPGSRKTAVVSAITKPLIEWEKIEGERLAPEIKRIAAKRHALERRKEKLTKEAANADSSEKMQEVLKKIELVDDEIPEELHAPRLWTGDTTPERLQSLLADHGERMAVLSDEGGIFEVMAGLYSGGVANLDIFLQGHAGHAVRVDRQGRSTHLDSPALSFGLAVQPDVLSELASGGKKRFRGNGTLARFLFAIPQSNIGSRDVRAVNQIPENIASRYRDGLFDLLSIPPLTEGGKEVSRQLSLTPEALELWHRFAEMVERRQGQDGDLETIQDWSAKLPGVVLRIAGGFHLVEHGSNPPLKIEAATIEHAIELCTLLIQHAQVAFGMMDGGSSTDDAKEILRWALEENLSRFARGLVYRKFKGRFTGKPDRLDRALQDLEERAIVTPVKEKTAGRAATVFVVHSSLWKNRN